MAPTDSGSETPAPAAAAMRMSSSACAWAISSVHGPAFADPVIPASNAEERSSGPNIFFIATSMRKSRDHSVTSDCALTAVYLAPHGEMLVRYCCHRFIPAVTVTHD